MKKLFTLLLIIMAFSAKADYWTQKADFGGAGVNCPFSFSIGNKGYIGTGSYNVNSYSNEFWEYDPSTNVWTQKANFGGGVRFGATGFSIGNKGYAGLGYDGGLYFQDFWEYDPATNIWTQKANFGGAIRYTAIGFSIGNFGYMGAGANLSAGFYYFDDLWQYDPTLDVWTQKTSLPAPRGSANSFVIGNDAYLVCGWNTSGVLIDLLEYNSITNSWSQKANFPSTERGDAAAFSICDKGYYGIGEGPGASMFHNDFWEYNPIADSWIQKTNFGGLIRNEAAYFSIGNKGYIGLGAGIIPPYYNDFWEYTPDSACATAIEEFQISNFDFQISPNPAHEYAVISWFPIAIGTSENKNAELLITTLEGKKVYETKLLTSGFRPDSYRVPTSDFPKGIYLVQIISNQKISATRKLVIE